MYIIRLREKGKLQIEQERILFLFFFAQKKFFCVCFTKFIAKFTSFKHMGSKGKFPNDIKKFEKK